MVKKLLYISFVCLFVSCSETDSFEKTSFDENELKEIISKYGLEVVENNVEYKTSEKLKPISNLEELEFILSRMNVIEEFDLEHDVFNSFAHIKTRSESGQNTVVISARNENGSASVHLDFKTPSVVTSTYQLGLMDAFVDYRHLSGRADKISGEVKFTANGEGFVKLIWNGVTLYKFNVEILGNCNLDGTGGKLTKF